MRKLILTAILAITTTVSFGQTFENPYHFTKIKHYEDSSWVWVMDDKNLPGVKMLAGNNEELFIGWVSDIFADFNIDISSPIEENEKAKEYIHTDSDGVEHRVVIYYENDVVILMYWV